MKLMPNVWNETNNKKRTEIKRSSVNNRDEYSSRFRMMEKEENISTWMTFRMSCALIITTLLKIWVKGFSPIFAVTIVNMKERCLNIGGCDLYLVYHVILALFWKIRIFLKDLWIFFWILRILNCFKSWTNLFHRNWIFSNNYHSQLEPTVCNFEHIRTIHNRVPTK